MDWLSKHADTTTVLAGILGAVCWMNYSIGTIHEDMAEIKIEMAVIRTVLVMKQIMPNEMAKESKDASSNAQ